MAYSIISIVDHSAQLYVIATGTTFQKIAATSEGVFYSMVDNTGEGGLDCAVECAACPAYQR